MNYYFHPKFGPYIGDRIAGDESNVISLSEYNELNQQWNPAPQDKTIEELAFQKINKINESKNIALSSGFYYNGILFDSDEKARLAYLELTTKFQMNPEYTTGWKASRSSTFSTWVTMDKNLYESLTVAYEQHIQNCFTWQAMKEQEVATAMASGDKSLVEAISTTFGE